LHQHPEIFFFQNPNSFLKLDIIFQIINRGYAGTVQFVPDQAFEEGNLQPILPLKLQGKGVKLR
jgi:hypothetical protein